jgi:hypothetical protein
MTIMAATENQRRAGHPQHSAGDGLQHLELLAAYGGPPVPVTGKTVPVQFTGLLSLRRCHP